jgi:signal transduction histidine kinase
MGDPSVKDTVAVGNQRILVIDDNQAIHDDFRKILCPVTTATSALSEAETELFGKSADPNPSGGFEIDSAYQGQEAWERVRQSIEKTQPYAVAFVDMRMPPGWDGIETTQKMWEVDPDLQVVICTAYSDHSWDEIISRLGNSDRLLLLKKPFDPVEILQLASALTEKWRLNRQVRCQMDHLESIVGERTKQLQVSNEQLTAEIAEHRMSKQRLQQALEELESAQDQVIQQERLRALGSMASGIAHDFNNSLVGILGLTELLLQRPENMEDKAKARRYLEMINTTAKDAGKIVNRLREFYRFREQREVTEAVNLNRVIDEAISLTQPRWKTQAEARNVFITVHKDLQEIPTVEGNLAELREVLTNLIFNAVDAMPRGGKISILTHCEGDQVVLEVSDTGVGMTEEIRHRCFEPFFTTKGIHGSGLGLSMVHGILQRHQATVEIRSEIDKGSTFIIRFPPQSKQTQTGSPAKPTETVQNLHVLVVDDEPMVRDVISQYLIVDGHQVETAVGGKEGVEKFKNNRFDLVLVDRAMPDMNGDQVASAIKSVNSTMPVVMLTGFGSMMEATGEKPPSVDLVVGKPITMVDLRAAVARVVGPHPA